MLSAESLKKIDIAIAKYPSDRRESAVMAALAIAQTEHGWLSAEIMQFIADYLKMPTIAVQEVATFYTMYQTTPVGHHKITVCTNLPCALSGGQDAADYLKSKLGIGFNETTPDGQFTLKEGECMGACADAPVLLVNNQRMCSWMSQEKLDQLLKNLSPNCLNGRQSGEDGAEQPEYTQVHEDCEHRPTSNHGLLGDLGADSKELAS